jgi:hypothetical protein
MNQTHELDLSHNGYGWWGECECSNPDFEGTGTVGRWSADRNEIWDWHLEHLDDVEL